MRGGSEGEGGRKNFKLTKVGKRYDTVICVFLFLGKVERMHACTQTPPTLFLSSKSNRYYSMTKVGSAPSICIPTIFGGDDRKGDSVRGDCTDRE